MAPWALKEYKGNIYVGTVCTAETSQDRNELSATIYKLNLQSEIFESYCSMPLTYIKGPSNATGDCP